MRCIACIEITASLNGISYYDGIRSLSGWKPDLPPSLLAVIHEVPVAKQNTRSLLGCWNISGAAINFLLYFTGSLVQ